MQTATLTRLIPLVAAATTVIPAAGHAYSLDREPIWPDYTWQAGATGFYFFDLDDFGVGGEFGAQWPHREGYHFFGFEGFAASGSTRGDGLDIDADFTSVLTSYRYHGFLPRTDRVGLYAGGSLGASRVRGTVRDRDEGSRDSLSDNTALTWGLGAGIEIAIVHGFSLRTGYRYISWERIARSDGPTRTIDDHGLDLSLNYKF